MTEDLVNVAVGDVIQIDPEQDRRFGGCLLLVTEVKGWGVVASVLVPNGAGPAQAPYRAPWGRFARIGPAAWPLE
jgi:hypothetical protein